MVVHEEFAILLLAKLFQRVGPQQIGHNAVGGRLAEPVNLSADSR